MIAWHLAGAFPRRLDSQWTLLGDLARHVDRLTGGALALAPQPAGEPIPAAAVLDAVAEGRVECGLTAGSFHLDRDPVLALATFAPFGMDARRHRAWLAGAGRAHVEAAWHRAGVVAMPCGNTGAQTAGWWKRPLERPEDLRGVRIRTAGLPALVLKRLGALPLALPLADIVPALERNELDAADFIGPADDHALGFHRAAPVLHWPGVMEPTAHLSLIVNRAAWQELPETRRAALEAAAALAEDALYARYDTLNPPELAALEADGARLVRLPGSVVAALREASTATLDALAAQNADFAGALDSYRAFARAGQRWHAIGERAVGNTIEG